MITYKNYFQYVSDVWISALQQGLKYEFNDLKRMGREKLQQLENEILKKTKENEQKLEEQKRVEEQKRLEEQKIKEEQERLKKEQERLFNERLLKAGIEDFINSDYLDFTIDNLDQRKLLLILTSITESPKYNIYIKRQNTYFPVTQDNINKLSKIIKFQEVTSEDTKSGEETIKEILQTDKITIEKKLKATTRAGGSFFPYINKTDIDLSKYGIFKKVDEKNYKVNCLIHAIIETKKFDNSTIQSLKLKVTDRHIPICKLKEVSDILKTKIILKQEGKKNTKKYGNYEDEIKLGLISDHYFIIDKTNINSYAIKNYESVKHLDNWQILKSKGKRERRPIDSYNLISIMLENNLLKKIDLSTANILKTQYYDQVEKNLNTLEYSDKCVRKVVPSIYNNVYLRLDSKFYKIKDDEITAIKTIKRNKTYVIFADDASKYSFDYEIKDDERVKLIRKYGYLISKNDIENIEEKTKFLGNKNLIYVRTYEEHIFEKNNRERIKYIKNHTIYVMYNKTRENAEEYIKSLFGDKNLKDTENYKKLLEFYDKKKRGLQTNKKITKEEKKKYKKIYYADFESTTEGKHKAYMCCVVSENSEKTFLGEDCGNKLLNYLETDSLIYFHNLGYDFAFFAKYFTVQKIIKSGSSIKIIKGIYKKKKLTFKDSAAMIPSALNKFSEMFKLSVQKEIMPYSLYTNETVKKNIVELKDALKYIKEKDKFLNLAKPYIEGEYFRHIAYAEFYCLQDCRVLKQGFETFRGWINEAFKLDCVDFVSLPSLSYKYLYNEGCFDGVYELSSTPRIFIQRCVKGGRCMTRDNRKWHIIGNQAISKDETITYDKECILNDFDGVSLYPSAMVRMPGFLRGKPKVLTNLTYDFLKRQSGYFVEIKNVKLNKFLHFPLQSEKINGIRNYTNEIKGSLYIDKVSLEDLIEFQGATFDIVRGYYFNEGHNTKIGSVIKFCFEERLKQKSKGNPIEQVYKLLMNSSYGKLIQKPIVTDLKFTNSEEKHKKYLSYNHNFIKEFTKICENKYVYKVQKSVNNHFNMCHIGSEILSWSKRIMNEVMCLAEDLDIHIFYQDTDSMHILDSQIKTLADAFYNKYGCKLIGKQLGQFHTDFSVIDSRDENGKKEIKNIENDKVMDLINQELELCLASKKNATSPNDYEFNSVANLNIYSSCYASSIRAYIKNKV